MSAEAEALRVQRESAELGRKIHPREVLAVQMQPNDAGAATVGEYLVKLLSLVWEHDEGFRGKRPFGSSGWKSDVGEALVRAGLIPGTWKPVDPDDPNEGDYLGSYDRPACDRLVQEAIAALGRG